MKTSLAITAIIVGLIGSSCSANFATNNLKNEETLMSARGTFEVNLTPEEDVDTPAGRMLINKTYKGDMVGSGIGQMISKRTDSGVAIYYAIEEFAGAVNGQKGGFTLVHAGFMGKDAETLDVNILQGSGTGELQNISGSMLITQDEKGHRYQLVPD